MSITGATGGPFHGIFDCCIAAGDYDVQRRPYHKNCTCALHNMQQRGGRGAHHCAPPRCNRVAYPIRRTWSDGCLSLMNATDAASPTRAAAAEGGKITRTRTQLVLCKKEDEEEDLDDLQV